MPKLTDAAASVGNPPEPTQMAAAPGILVTRPVDQADELCRALEQAGFQPIRFPTIEIAPLDNPALPPTAPILIFVSTNAVRHGLPQLDPVGKTLIAVGRATARALQAASGQRVITADTGQNSEALLALPDLQQLDGIPITIVRGVGGRELLATTLRRRGARVSYLECYRRRLPQADSQNHEQVCRALRNGRLAAITATSVETLENLDRLLPSDCASRLRKRLLVGVSERVIQRAQSLGYQRVANARSAHAANLVDCLTTSLKTPHVDHRRTPRSPS